MKKVLVAVVLMMGIGSFSAFAAEISVDSVVIACEVIKMTLLRSR